MKIFDIIIYLNQKWKKRNQIVVIVKRSLRKKILHLLFMGILIMILLHKINVYYHNHFILLKMEVIKEVIKNINIIFLAQQKINH